MKEVVMECKELTRSQKLIMRCVWDYEGRGDISYSELLNILREEYGHDYKLVTLVTFLRQMADKGYLMTYRRGKSAFVRPIVSQSEYRVHAAKEMTDYWFDGRLSRLIQTLADAGALNEEDRAQIKAML